MRSGQKAQGAIEYLLILGAAILVASIVIIAATGALGSGKNTDALAQNEYARQLQNLRQLGTNVITLSGLTTLLFNENTTFADFPQFEGETAQLSSGGQVYTFTGGNWVPTPPPINAGEYYTIFMPAGTSASTSGTIPATVASGGNETDLNAQYLYLTQTPTINTPGTYGFMAAILGNGSLMRGVGPCIIAVTVDGVTINGHGHHLNCDINASGTTDGQNGHSVVFTNIDLNGVAYANGTNSSSGNGGNGGSITATDTNIYQLQAIGGNATGTSGNGGTGGTAVLTRVIQFSTISIYGGNGLTAGNGGRGGSMTATSVSFSGNPIISITGGTSQKAGTNPTNGGVGGDGGLINASFSSFYTINLKGGNAAVDYGHGGSGGTVTINDSNMSSTLSAYSGYAGINNSTNPAYSGNGGNVTLTRCRFNTINTGYGVGNTTYGNSSLAGNGGTVNITSSTGTYVNAYGGATGNTAIGSTGGIGGTVNFVDSNVTYFYAYGGSAPAPSAIGGNGGNITIDGNSLIGTTRADGGADTNTNGSGGNGGTIIIKNNSLALAMFNASGGSGGSTGASAKGGNAGSITLKKNTATTAPATLNISGGSATLGTGGNGGTYYYCGNNWVPDPPTQTTPLNISGGTGATNGTAGTTQTTTCS